MALEISGGLREDDQACTATEGAGTCRSHAIPASTPAQANPGGERAPDLRSNVEGKIQEILETNFELQERITDDTNFGEALRDHHCNEYIPCHRRVEELLKLQESKTVEFKSSH